MKQLFVPSRHVDIVYKHRCIEPVARRKHIFPIGLCARPSLPYLAQVRLAGPGRADQHKRMPRPVWPAVDPGNGFVVRRRDKKVLSAHRRTMAQIKSELGGLPRHYFVDGPVVFNPGHLAAPGHHITRTRYNRGHPHEIHHRLHQPHNVQPQTKFCQHGGGKTYLCRGIDLADNERAHFNFETDQIQNSNPADNQHVPEDDEHDKPARQAPLQPECHVHTDQQRFVSERIKNCAEFSGLIVALGKISIKRVRCAGHQKQDERRKKRGLHQQIHSDWYRQQASKCNQIG